ncbi:MAG TPA: DUF3987 domain-containing protein [Verrucomicrobiales bacterium]|jgi:hypothetical protein|nr:DUF3987 domain-containing protein [Verrucomicrobiales bacterium]
MSESPADYDAGAIQEAMGTPPPLTEPDAATVASEFPLDALPQPLRSMAYHASLQTGAPISLCAAAGIGIASASIGSGLAIQSSPARTTRANLFILAVAQSGTGKGEAFKAMMFPFYSRAQCLMQEWIQDTRPRLLSDAEIAKADLEAAKRDRKRATSDAERTHAAEEIRDATARIDSAERALAREPILSIGNATAEAICESIANSPGEALAIISAEARDTVDILLGRYSRDGKGSDESIFLKGYSGDPMETKRKGKPPIVLQRPCLTLCLAFQPDIWLRVAGDPRMMESGFLPRCLAFDAKGRPARPTTHTIPADVSHPWESLLFGLLDHIRVAETTVIVPVGDATRAIIDDFANEAADAREVDGKWATVIPFAARLGENAWRIALTLHAILHGKTSHEVPLELATASAAVILTRWYFGETLSLLKPAQAKRRQTRMERLIEVFKLKQVQLLTLRILKEHHGYGEPELCELAAAFPTHLRIETITSSPQGGRASRVAQIAPFST